MTGWRIGFMELFIIFVLILMTTGFIVLVIRLVKKVSNKDAMEDRIDRIEKEIEEIKNK
jgi:hypothetical protein